MLLGGGLSFPKKLILVWKLLKPLFGERSLYFFLKNEYCHCPKPARGKNEYCHCPKPARGKLEGGLIMKKPFASQKRPRRRPLLNFFQAVKKKMNTSKEEGLAQLRQFPGAPSMSSLGAHRPISWSVGERGLATDWTKKKRY